MPLEPSGAWSCANCRKRPAISQTPTGGINDLCEGCKAKALATAEAARVAQLATPRARWPGADPVASKRSLEANKRNQARREVLRATDPDYQARQPKTQGEAVKRRRLAWVLRYGGAMPYHDIAQFLGYLSAAYAKQVVNEEGRRLARNRKAPALLFNADHGPNPPRLMLGPRNE